MIKIINYFQFILFSYQIFYIIQKRKLSLHSRYVNRYCRIQTTVAKRQMLKIKNNSYN